MHWSTNTSTVSNLLLFNLCSGIIHRVLKGKQAGEKAQKQVKLRKYNPSKLMFLKKWIQRFPTEQWINQLRASAYQINMLGIKKKEALEAISNSVCHHILSLFFLVWPAPIGQKANDRTSSRAAPCIYIHPATVTAVSLIPQPFPPHEPIIWYGAARWSALQSLFTKHFH